MKKRIIVKTASVITAVIMLTSCGSTSAYDNFVIPEQGESDLKPVADCFIDDPVPYENEAPYETALITEGSSDGLCVIKKMPSYYDVTLDLEKGSHYDCGKAYAETIMKIFPDFEELLEPYLYENLRLAFSEANEDYSFVVERANKLFENLDKDYRDEILGMIDGICDGTEGCIEDKSISKDEMLIAQMLPDTVRSTSCSVLSVWGDKTVNGGKITLRNLEWPMGSEYQMCLGHAVLHLKNGERSITSITVLGILDLMTGINDNGVMTAILDVGCGGEFIAENKLCYTYTERYVLENFDNAVDAANYVNSKSGDFTYCHNLLIADSENTFCAENCVSDVEEEYGRSIVRSVDTPLLGDLKWEGKNSLCVVNSFVSKGNFDFMSGNEGNLIRWEKYRKFVNETDKFSVADMKGILAKEKLKTGLTVTVHQPDVYQSIIFDHSTGNLQISFTGTEGVREHPEFVSVEG